MKKSKGRDADEQISVLALRLANGAGRGPVPDLEEIERFRDGTLGEPRRTEVLSHLARDPACFQMLHDLETAERHLAAVEASRSPSAKGTADARTRSPRDLLTALRRRLQSISTLAWGSGLAGAMATVMIVITVLPILPLYRVQLGVDAGYDHMDSSYALSPDAWPGYGIPQSKGFGLDFFEPRDTIASDDRRAFKAGVRAGLESLVLADRRWLSVIDELPEAAPDCPLLDRRCRARRMAAEATGRWTVMIFAQCQADGAAHGFWAEQDEVRRRLTVIARRSQQTFVVDLGQLAGDHDPRRRLCEGIDAVLQDGLSD